MSPVGLVMVAFLAGVCVGVLGMAIAIHFATRGSLDGYIDMERRAR